MSDKKFFRKCPNCLKDIGYTTERQFRESSLNNSFCIQCCSLKRKTSEKKFFRECPNCKKQIGYTTKKNLAKAKRTGGFCYNCRANEVKTRPETIAKRKVLWESYKTRFKGEKNPFYGRHHTEETKNKIKDIDRAYTQTIEFKEKSARKGKLNGMYGKTVYEVWIKRYGKEEADKKLLSLKKRCSEKTSGKNNPMYGKPAPIGSGNGWSGWYKSWYFRSLRELSYMIQVIEKNNYKWSSAENKNLEIKYVDYNGEERTYRADFFINDSILVEVKPKKMMEIPNNVLKKEAAILFCKSKGYKYRMIDVKILDMSKIIDLHKKSLVVFIDKYKEKLEKIICKLEKKEK